MRVYGSKVSYYTGKLESYLRYKGIPYELLPLYGHEKRVRTQTGTSQMPAVELEDGRWMSDSTPIILYLEEQHPDSPILPEDPVLRYLAFLIEDYADEWLWRSAMHYRWSYRQSRELLRSILTDEQMQHLSMPRFMKLRMIARRQRNGFVLGDGVTEKTWDHVEQGYFNALDNMSRMLEKRAYLFGPTPSIADFGLMGPMLRHFGQDPTPAEIMRNRAPRVYEWVARLWNQTSDSTSSPSWVETMPEEGQPMLKEVCETHLRQLALNADAFEAGLNRFDGDIQGCAYRALPVSRYRVWCLEKLRERYLGLAGEDQDRLRSILKFPEADILWSENFSACSKYDEKNEAPFNRAINVYAEGEPK